MSSPIPSAFRCGITRDFLTADGSLVYRDIGLQSLSEAGVCHSFLERNEKAIPSDLLGGYDAVISLTPAYTAASFAPDNDLLAIVRFGVGYDMVDVEACTEAGVLLCITRGAVNHSVGEAILSWMLALSHRVADKDRLVRQNRWSERGQYMGSELRNRTLGLVGAGGIGKHLLTLLTGLRMAPPLVFDPYLSESEATQFGLRKVDLNTLLKESDFVSINCPLNRETQGLIGPRELARMKPTAYLINTARGGIVQEAALIETLERRDIAGAGIDVFAVEPVGADHPLTKLDNVLLAPHCISWTDDLFAEIGNLAARAVIDLAAGEVPYGLAVNPAVTEKPAFQAKLAKRIGETELSVVVGNA